MLYLRFENGEKMKKAVFLALFLAGLNAQNLSKPNSNMQNLGKANSNTKILIRLNSSEPNLPAINSAHLKETKPNSTNLGKNSAGLASQSAPQSAQNAIITLENAITRARAHYPLHKNKELLARAQSLELTRLNMNYIPQIRLSAKATYQSDVTKLPFNSTTLSQMTGVSIDYKPLNKDQYNANIEISQPLLDSGSVWANKSAVSASYASHQAELDSALYGVQNLVINAYFSALLLDKQIKQSTIHINELETNLKTLNARYQNGVANKSDIDKIRVQILQAQKANQSLQNERDIALQTLKELVGASENKNIELVAPDFNEAMQYLSAVERDLASINFSYRPEMQVFALKADEIALQKRQEIARSLPYIDAFLQVGYANPALNILKSDFDEYYIAGIRLNWNFSNLYSTHQQNELRRVQALQIHSQKEEFLLNAKIALKQHIKKAKSLQNSLKQDTQIISAQEELTKSAAVRLKNGILSTNDFLSEINELNALKLQHNYDEIEFLLEIVRIRQTLNDWVK